MGISTGKVNSELHNTFHNGSRKDRERLKITNKLGPAKLSKTEVFCNEGFIQYNVN